MPERTDCFIYLRELEGECYLVVCNYEDAQEINGLPEGKLLLSNANREIGVNGKYAAYECAVWQLT